MRQFLLVLLIAFSQAVSSQDFSLYEKHWFSAEDSRLPYRLLYPASFDSTANYPVVVFLHGASARGNDNESQLQIGGRFFLRPENREKFPAIILFPQCASVEVWADFNNATDPATGLSHKWTFPFNKKPTFPLAALIELLDSMKHLSFVDKNRIYIGGLSQGGMGVFDIVARRPDLFAAAFPICGGGKISTAKKFAGKVAMWIFHGEKDDVVPTHFSRDFYKALQKEKSDVRYTEYPGVYHNSWINALTEPELLSWLFSKKKNDP
jgi:predicted peptidase